MSMREVQGTVSKVLERNWNGTVFYSLAVAGEEDLFGTGDRKPPTRQGDLVKFRVKKNDKGYWNIDGNITTLQAIDPSTPIVNTDSGGDRQQSIVRQHSQEMALRLLDILIAADALVLPKEKEKKLPVIEGFVTDYTAKFYADALPQAAS